MVTCRRGFCYVCLLLLACPFLLILGFYIALVYNLFDLLTDDALDDSYAGNPKTFNSIPSLRQFDYHETLGGDGRIRRGGQKWVYVTGNTSCGDELYLCEMFDQAFSALTHQFEHENPYILFDLTSLDCDAYPSVCNNYWIAPPGIVHISGAGPCELKRGEVEGWDYFCPTDSRPIRLPVLRDLYSAPGNFPDATYQLRKLIKNPCVREEFQTPEEWFQAPQNGWVEWVAWQMGTGVGYLILGVNTVWNSLRG
ncbi:MAG: hypothetical protein Q9227_007497 [Pyrenula ochraceoflavens]